MSPRHLEWLVQMAPQQARPAPTTSRQNEGPVAKAPLLAQPACGGTVGPLRSLREPGRWPAILALAASTLLPGCGVQQAAPAPDIPATAVSVPFVSLLEVQYSDLTQPARMVVKTAAEWEDLWSAAVSKVSPSEEVPRVDFTRRMVLVAAMGGRPTGGFDVLIRSVFEDKDNLYAVYVEVSPGTGCLTTQGFTAPVSAVSVPLSGKPVRFIRREDSVPCG